ncbi:MAG: OB-fold protein [Gemmatimonadaceae bacterium]
MAIKTCKECGKEVSTSAKQCPHCGKQHPTGGTSVGAIIVVALIVLIGIGQFPRSPSSSSTAAAENATQSDATPAVTEPVVAVSAAQLFADYQANEVAADNQYIKAGCFELVALFRVSTRT